jgi:hypothetical protein
MSLTLDDIAEVAFGLPDGAETMRRGWRTWTVAGTAFAWERAFTKADVKRFAGAPVPEGPIVAVRLEDLGEKEAVLAAGMSGVFTIPHFDGYAAVLVDLSVAEAVVIRELVIDGWLACAPGRLAEQFIAGGG